jgi:hypothetical protein
MAATIRPHRNSGPLGDVAGDDANLSFSPGKVAPGRDVGGMIGLAWNDGGYRNG